MSDDDTGDDLPDGEYVAVLDSVEGSEAVLRVETSGEGTGDRVGVVSVRRETLPRRGARPGGVFTVTLVGGELTTVAYEKAETMRRRSARRSRDEDR